MPNIATLLKAEIARVARKQLRGEVQELKKASAQHRSHIASLRRRIDELERQIKRAQKSAGRTQLEQSEQSSEGVQRRFSPARLAAQRRKLGLSAADFAALVGVSPLSIYNWEHGKTRPRQQQLEAIAAVRGIGKREALARLEVLRAAEG